MFGLLSDMLLSDYGHIETISVSFVADLDRFFVDLAIICPGVCRELEDRVVVHLCFEEHRHRVIVIIVLVAVVDRLCDQYVILVEIEGGGIVRTGFMGSEVGHEVEHLAAGNGERVQYDVSLGRQHERCLVRVEVVSRDPLALEGAYFAVEPSEHPVDSSLLILERSNVRVDFVLQLLNFVH